MMIILKVWTGNAGDGDCRQLEFVGQSTGAGDKLVTDITQAEQGRQNLFDMVTY
jgi:hypothetical protein